MKFYELTGRYVRTIWWDAEKHSYDFANGECIVIDLPGEMAPLLYGKSGEVYWRLNSAEGFTLWPKETP